MVNRNVLFYPAVLESIESSGKLSDDDVKTLEQAIDDFKQSYVTVSGQPLVKDEPVSALGEGEEDLTVLRRRTRDAQGIQEAARPDAGE